MRTALAALVAVGCVLPALPAAGAVPPGLYVTFRANHTITTTFADGTVVGTSSGSPTVIPPGTYDLYMDDSISVSGPQFDLQGPGVDFVDSMFYGENPSETYSLTFEPSSTYTWKDDESPNVVFTFVTSASGGSSGTTAPTSGQSSGVTGTKTTGTSSSVVGSNVVAFRGTVTATVAANGKVSLAQKGKAVTSLKSGRYAFALRDASKSAGFALQQLKHTAAKLTSAAFVGRKTITLQLAAGQWLYYAAPAHKTYFVIVRR